MKCSTLWGKLASLISIVAIATLLIESALWILGRGALPMESAASAAAVCLTGGCLAFVAMDRLSQPHERIASVGLATMIRMGVPLSSLIVAQFSGAPLVSAGFPYYLLTFYIVTLVTETLLLLPVPERKPAQKVG